MARRCMLRIVGGVIWVALLAIVLSSIFGSEKLNAAPRSVAQPHHKQH